MRTSVATTCLCWLGAYLLGSVPIGHLLERSRLRRDLRRLEGGRRRRHAPEDLRVLLGGSTMDPSAALPTLTEVAGAALDTAKVVGLAVATAAIVRASMPGGVRDISGFGVLSFWESASLWAGLAAAVGHVWPVWLGFRSGGQGQAPVLALAVRFTPVGFVVAVGGYLVARLAGARAAVALSLGGFLVWSWAAWVWNLPHWWGLVPSAEVAVWAAVLAGTVGALNLSRPRS